MRDLRAGAIAEANLAKTLPIVHAAGRARLLESRITDFEGELGSSVRRSEAQDHETALIILRDGHWPFQYQPVARAESDLRDEDAQPTNSRAVCSKSSVESRSDSWSIRSLFPWNIFAKSLNEMRSLMSP